MTYDYNNNFQYNSCIAHGICSQDPRTTSLQEVLILYLKLTAFYASKLQEKNIFNIKARNIILNTISIMVSNFSFTENDFKAFANGFKKVLPDLINKYETIYEKQESLPLELKPLLDCNETTNIINAIKFGEKEFFKKISNLSTQVRNLYKILLVLAKSICINILDLESFDTSTDIGYLTILNILNSLNSEEKNIEEIKKTIIKTAKIDNELMQKIQNAKQERYGIPESTEVSFSTTHNKAILVIGSNIKELEEILEAVKNSNIDIYTHDEMILANTYPKFHEYKNLKGQYGQGIENCLLDFATFPGPIILTRHSLFNIEHLYRGLLYTTDFASSKGVIQIKNKDFTEVIHAAYKAKGFKTGKQRESIKIGFHLNDLIENIKKHIEKYSRIFIVGIGDYTIEQKTYFEKLFQKAPQDTLIISLSYCIKKENIICVNSYFDDYAITQITNSIIENFKIPITIFFPKCNKHTISQIINLTQNKQVKIYLGQCTPIMLNPALIASFKDYFNIKSITSVKKDLQNIMKE